MSFTFKPITNSQYNLAKAYSKFILVACEPGAGASYGLAMKAIQEASNSGKFVLYICNMPTRPGSAIEIFKSLLDEGSYRYSDKSQIFTFPSNGRVKLVNFTAPHTWAGCAFDWVICDHRFQVIDKYAIAPHQRVVVSAYPDVISTDPWFGEFMNGEQYADCSEIVKMSADDNFFMKGDPYFDYAREAIPQHFGFPF